MDKIWNELHEAAMRVINPREVSRMIEAGGGQIIATTPVLRLPT